MQTGVLSKMFSAAGVLIILHTFPLQAQVEDYRGGVVKNINKPVSSYAGKNLISMEPMPLLVRGVQLGYERFLSRYSSLKLRAGYYRHPEAGNLYGGADWYNGKRVETSFRYYFEDDATSDLRVFMAGYALYKEMDMRGLDPRSRTGSVKKTFHASAVGLGLNIGGFYKINYSSVVLGGSVGGGHNIPVDHSGASRMDVMLINPFKEQLTVQLEVFLGIMF